MRFWNKHVRDLMGLYKQNGDRIGYDGICVDDLISSYINSISWQADPVMWLLFRIRWAKLEKHVVWFAGCFEPFPWTKLSKDWHALSSWSILFCWELFFPDFNCNVLGRSLLNTGVNKSELRPYSASDIFSFIIIYIPCLFPGKLPDKSGKHLFCTESLCIRLAFYFKTYNETEDVFCFLNWISCAWTFINPFF